VTTTDPQRREAARMLALGGSPRGAFDLLERQLGVLVLRTQVLLSLCGIVITVTGFSGRSIAQTGLFARAAICVGIVTVLASASVLVWGVLRLQWLTQIEEEEPAALVLAGLAIRDEKSVFLRQAALLFVAGFTCYVLAIADMLWSAP
jgi:hypothetical protein